MEALKDKKLQITIGTAIVTVVAVVGFTLNIGTRFERVEASIRHLNGKTDLYEERYDVVIVKQGDAAILNAEIRTKLDSIETAILEIKNDLRNCEK